MPFLSLFRVPAIAIATFWALPTQAEIGSGNTSSKPAASSQPIIPSLAPRAVKGRMAEVRLTKSTWTLLARGAPCYAGSDKYHWEEVPTAPGDMRFSQSRFHEATLQFTVTESGLVFMATTTRFGEGGRKGDWVKELTSERSLTENGWHRVPELAGLKSNEAVTWIVFYRACTKGESFSIRTEKYCAPILLTK